MAGRSASNNITRYAGIQVQTSSLGVQIPMGWGTFRCKCNLVDYLDFASKAQKAASAGKGGSTTTGYSYSATIILALCEGPIDAITTVYVGSKVYVYNSPYSTNANTGTTSAMAQAGLTLATGAIGQAPWSYLTSNHPAHAIGYSGLAIAYAANYALDSGASTPNHSFEMVKTTGFGVSGTPDADPSLVVTDFFENTRTGVPSWKTGLLGNLSQYQDYCLAAGLLISPVIDSQRSASDWMNELLRATNSTCVWSEGLLKFIPYGDVALTGNGKTYTPNNTAVYSLDDDDFIPKSDGDPPILVEIMDQSDAYNVVQLEYLDRTNQYNMAIALASDAANVAQYGMRRKDPDTVHMICTPAVAQQSAQLWLQRTLYIRAQYKITLSWAFAILEPGDIIEITDAGMGLNAYPVRIIQIDEDEDGALEITAEDFPIGISTAPLYVSQVSQGYVTNQAIDPGSVEANLLLWSEDQTNAAWAKTNLTVTANSTTDPYGGSAADTLVTTTANAAHGSAQAFTGFAGLPYTFSAFIKPAGRKIVQLGLLSTTDGAGATVSVDTSTGTVTVAATATGNATGAFATVTAAANGFYRVSISAAFAAETALEAAISVLSDAGATSYAGDGSSGLYVWGAQLKQGVDVPVYAATQGAIAGPILFNPPSALTSGGSATWAAVSGGANWGGCYVWASVDGSSYGQVGQIDGGARYGVTTTSFASGSDPDTTDTVGIDLGASAGVLTSAADAAADASSTLCLIDQELISYSEADLINPSRFTLDSYIRRGVLNTPIAAHSAGAPFVRLDSSVFELPYLATQQGQTIYVKFQSFNHWGKAVQSLADCNVYTAVPNPVGPRAPTTGVWTATGTTLSTGSGVLVPAIQITGSSDNASASGVIFYYRPTGSTPWTSSGVHPINTTTYDITSVIASESYDVAVAYLVNGVIGTLKQIGTVTTGNPGYGALAVLNTTGTSEINGNAVTIRSGADQSGNTYGSGATVLILTYTLTLPYAADVLFTGTASQSYVGGVPGTTAQLTVDGTQVSGMSTGASIYTSTFTMSAIESLAAGTHVVDFYWYGGNSDVYLSNAVLIVDAAMR